MVSNTSSSNSSGLHPQDSCVHTVMLSVFMVLCISYFLLLPLFSFVLFLGFQQWRKRRSGAVAAATAHSDIFTFSMAALEIFSVLGTLIFCYGFYTKQPLVMKVASFVFGVTSNGQTLFHLLTCVERYLAVVHPVTYLSLRHEAGVRIRNISIGCAWLICFVLLSLSEINQYMNIISGVLLLVFSSGVVSFCSLSVLCVLIRPRPGEAGRNRERVDQSKQRAFYTIVIIMAALLVRFLCTLVYGLIYYLRLSGDGSRCLVWMSVAWFSLPSSLVLPLLFLHRTGRLPCVKGAREGWRTRRRTRDHTKVDLALS